MEIKNSHILITGCNRGIGRAVAEVCAQDGAHLYLANRTMDDKMRDQLLNLGAPSVTALQADLGTREGVEKLLSDVKNIEIDILFNNAGQLTGGLLEEQTLNDIYSLLQVNVNALIHLTHGILPGMIQRKRGKIINHSSVSAVMHFPCATTYAASKAAVSAFTNSLRAELKGTGVSTLVLITPGVETAMYNDIFNKYGKHLDLNFLKSMPATKYAKVIREAILEDIEISKPPGVGAMGVILAQHLPRVFEKIAVRGFKR